MKAKVVKLLQSHYDGIPDDIEVTDDEWVEHLQDINNQMPAGIKIVKDYGVNFYDERLPSTAGVMLERTSVSVTADGTLLMLYYGDCGIEIKDTRTTK
jgi:hypothetical protein